MDKQLHLNVLQKPQQGLLTTTSYGFPFTSNVHMKVSPIVLNNSQPSFSLLLLLLLILRNWTRITV